MNSSPTDSLDNAMQPRTDEAEANSGVKEQDARGGSGRGTSRETRRDFGSPFVCSIQSLSLRRRSWSHSITMVIIKNTFNFDAFDPFNHFQGSNNTFPTLPLSKSS